VLFREPHGDAEHLAIVVGQPDLTRPVPVRIRLLTNNPHKLDFLQRAGLDVADRIALLAPVNPFNARYVQTKHERAGHFAQT